MAEALLACGLPLADVVTFNAMLPGMVMDH
jgi:hypothetical protein